MIQLERIRYWIKDCILKLSSLREFLCLQLSEQNMGQTLIIAESNHGGKPTDLEKATYMFFFSGNYQFEKEHTGNKNYKSEVPPRVWEDPAFPCTLLGKQVDSKLASYFIYISIVIRRWSVPVVLKPSGSEGFTQQHLLHFPRDSRGNLVGRELKVPFSVFY